MIYPYMVKYNGTYYPTGVDVPDGEKAHKEPISEEVGNSPKVEEKAVETAKKPTKRAKKED